MYDLKAQYLLEGIEIAIAVQEFVFRLQTESGNQTIDGLANGVAAVAQVPVVVGGGNGQGAAAGLKNVELHEVSLDLGERVLVLNTLQYFAKNEIREPDPLPLRVFADVMQPPRHAAQSWPISGSNLLSIQTPRWVASRGSLPTTTRFWAKQF